MQEQDVSDKRQMLFDVLNSIILKGVERAKSQQKQQINRVRIGQSRVERVQEGEQRKQVNKLEIEMAADWQSEGGLQVKYVYLPGSSCGNT